MNVEFDRVEISPEMYIRLRTARAHSGTTDTVFELVKNRTGIEFHPVAITGQAWTGEGLPPVGVECEYLWQWSDKIVYVRIKVLSHDEERAQFRVISGGGIGSLRECNQRLEDGLPMFRPIRTPEQIAEEAKQKAVDVIEKRIMDRMGDLNVRNLAEDLFGLLGEISKPTDQ